MDNKEIQPLASELYEDLKEANAFKEKVIKWLLAVIVLLVILLGATNAYHIYEWSQFDTVVVDSGDGDGNANYVQGDNSGGIYNGTSGSTSPEEGQLEGDEDQA